jgi:penicillin-binding protein 1A
MDARLPDSELSRPSLGDRVHDALSAVPRWLWWSLAALLVVGIGGAIAFWWLIMRGLPDAGQLAAYQPPLPTHVRAADGTPFHTFARERRIYLPYEETPELVIQAFLAAEDKNFFDHGGIDLRGIGAAILTNIENLGSDRRPVGASTITQQVAKNVLLTNEVTLARKLREAVLAFRMEGQFTKERILEIYFNEIFLGRNAYGVEAAAQAWFGKAAADLNLPEAAFLAALPKAPSSYNPVTNYDRALERRNWVLGEMVRAGFISEAEAQAARATPIAIVPLARQRDSRVGDYFLEEVRRQLITMFGEDATAGPNSVYAGGLWVRSTIDPKIQAAAEQALRDGLVRYDRARGWRGPSATIELGEGWERRLRAVNLGTGYDDWRAAVVLGRDGAGFRIGFEDGTEGRMAAGDATMARGGQPAHALLRAGDVIPVARVGGPASRNWGLRQIPEVQGALVVQEVQTGRILAMVGGFDLRHSSFNRATQAERQPGSTFKPFVLAAGLDNGMTPASIVSDAPYCVYQSRALGTKCFRNYGGGHAGAQTMRWGIEQSRNLMTVRIAYNAGMERVTKLAQDLGIGSYSPVLAIALGAGETTPIRLVNAFSILADHGKEKQPILFDMVQDRNGNVIWRADPRACEGCSAEQWQGQAMPRPADTRRQVMDARTAYQVTHMLEGVIERGTATTLRPLGIPIMGKTGTTTGPTDVWFVGGTPEVMAGLYIGFDRPRRMGGVQGGTFAAPIWKRWFELAYEGNMPEPKPFIAPAGVRMVRIERRSGRRVFGTFPGFEDPRAAIIWEAFKADEEPRRIARAPDTSLEARPQARVRTDSDFLRQQGGIY